MNRLKLWLYILVVLGAGLVNMVLVTQAGSADALRDLDVSLATGASVHRARERLMSGQAAAVAALAAKDDLLLEALAAGPRPEPRKKGKAAEPAGDPRGEARVRHEAAEAAASAAVKRAAGELGIELPAAAFWAVTSGDWLERGPPPEDGQQKEVAAFLRDATGGGSRRGYVRINDGLWFGAAQAASQGAGLAIFLPVDAAWAGTLKREVGCDVTVDASTPQLVTTASPEQARAAVSAAQAAPGGPVGHGALGPIQLTMPLRIKVPLLFTRQPAFRSLAVELTGLPRGFVVLSLPTARAFNSVAHYQWVSIEVLAGLVVVGLLLGLLLRTEVLPQVPSSLIAVATKIERGDFSARAPVYAGALGTVGGALNKAAEAAELAHAPAARVDPFASPPPEAAEPHFDFSARPDQPASVVAPAAALPSTDAKDTTARLDGIVELATAGQRARPEPALGVDTGPVRPVPRPAPAPAMASAGLTALGMPAVTAASATPGAEEDEEVHWRAIHAEFLETRARCGESIENLGFERFRPKLEKNKEALMQKYGCRAVRFSVYVKEGKAALKATPVK